MKLIRLFLIIACLITSNLPAQMSPHSPTIAVVGAGLAGLTTAYRLHQAGYEVEVYEAQNRIGGRAYSVYINGSINELGGNNIFDGGEALHLLNLAQEFGLEIETIDHHIVRSLNFNGKQYNNEDVQNHLAQLGDIAPAIHAAATTANNLKEIIDSVFANDDFLKFYFNDFLSRYEGADTSQLTTHSVNTLISFTQFIDTITFGTIKGGNALLPTRIAETLSNHIHLNTPLKQLSYNNQNYTLHFANGHTVAADCVVLAIPAAVYSDIQIDPAILPSSLQAAIQSIQYSPASKIIIPAQCIAPSLNIALTNDYSSWFNPTKDGLTFIYPHPLHPDQTEAISIHIQHEVQTFNNIIPSLQALSTSITTLKNEQFAYYTDALVINWSNEPYSKGAWSSHSCCKDQSLLTLIDSYGEKTTQLFQPTNNHTLFFSGEHTTTIDEIGTLEAAVESGERTARMIRNRLKGAIVFDSL